MRPGRFFNKRSLEDRRRKLRGNLTPAEATLWRLLQRSRLQGRKFRRQHSIGPYIVDFYCAEERLIVELEGSAHDSEQSAERDDSRERFLSNAGLAILRLENRHVFENPDDVLELIKQHFRSSHHPVTS
jgi:very-short-patch-repair endonuclease